MRVSSKQYLVVSLALAGVCLLGAVASAKSVAYPGGGHTSFMVDVPDHWTITPGKEAGDYMDLESGNGVLMEMRTLDATHEALQEAIADSEKFINENYEGVELNPVQNSEMNGLKYSFVTGTGKDKEGNAVKLAMGWFKLKDGTLGEIWYAADASDAEGIQEAGKVFSTYRAP